MHGTAQRKEPFGFTVKHRLVHLLRLKLLHEMLEENAKDLIYVVYKNQVYY